MEQLRTLGRELAMASHAAAAGVAAGAAGAAVGGWVQSSDFLNFVKSIGEARSKSDEDSIIALDLAALRRRISDPDLSRRKVKELVLRLVYAEMLGHDASFGHILAVKTASDESLALKRTGYLAVSLFVDEGSELVILLVNTIQKDLRSDNYLVVCAALTAVCKLIGEETIPAVLPQVVELLSHPKEAVRKKAVMALHRFHQKAPGAVSHLLSHFRQKLCDNDPGVMGAALCPLYDLISEDPNAYKDLVHVIVNILKQVAEKKLPTSYDYHLMPAPFIQIKILKILSLLGSGDKQASGHMYTVLGDIFRKCEASTNIGNAMLYECICCVSSIYPNPKLLSTAAEATSKFLKSESHNLKYMGIDALGRLIKVSPDIAEEHQLAVIDCLEDPDDTLKRKTFELLYKMTKSTNVEVIVDRMIDYMINIHDSHYKTEIASRCVELAEQFAPSNQWFIQVMNKVFEHAGDLVNIRVAHNLMRLIAEGFGEEDEGADSQLRSSAVDSYLRILGEPTLPSVFLQIICWVLGEYGTADGRYSASYIIGKLCDVAEAHSSDDVVLAYTISAIMKIFSFEKAAGRMVDLLPECQSLIEELVASHSTDLQQRAYELQSLLLLDRQAVEIVMPSDASCEDIEVDRNLPFLNSYVQQALQNGARPYIPENERSGAVNLPNLRSQIQQETSSLGLKFEAYELPKPPVPSPSIEESIPIPSTSLVPVSDLSYYQEDYPASRVPSGGDLLSADGGVKLRLDGVQKKWGRPTYGSSTSSSSSSVQKSANGPGSSEGASSSQKHETSYDTRRQQAVEISAEKQKLAASLFGATAKTERKAPSTRKAAKESAANADKAPTVKANVAPEHTKEPVVPSAPPPDLLDLGEPAPSTALLVDPFHQLEGLIAPSSASPALADLTIDTSSTMPDLMTALTGVQIGESTSLEAAFADINLTSTASSKAASPAAAKKGPNLREALQKDANVRQVGVTPTGNNPNLFSDLLH